uniref:Polyketide synthase-like protein Preu9 n=1 Tax=Preussia isomera TaxID=325670 RepID=PREU9_PREIS|nr:RecName: Full=Polyketide synthase-like protein Preu9 [Preussia isomera]UNY67721.1 polyketide synthase Preu9 [Preussia isomera]
MYALHLAVNAIRAGDCESAIVASANWIGDPGVQIALDKLGALSASARCHTFDLRAEGYARGEGFGAIYLKKTSLAISSGSPIRAMIRGTAMNSNGRTGGITRPSASGQEAVIREAYRNAGRLSFKDTGYFECHGTGTYVGDPIEVAAVGRVFASDRNDSAPLLVGSVKSNVGHSEGASALAAVMKVVLALENGAIPPIYDLQTRNPNIDFEGARVLPVTEVTEWPKDRLRRASINSFGYGGANAHCIIDHVNNVLADYEAPGVYRSIDDSSRNGVQNGHLNEFAANGTTNAPSRDHRNGITDGRADGNTNGHPNANGDVGGNPINGQANGDALMIHHPPMVRIPKKMRNAITRRLVLLPLSAHNETSLDRNWAEISQVLPTFPLFDIAYTLGARRSRYPQRTFTVVNSHTPVQTQSLVLDRKPTRAPLQTATIGFVFTGQGAQWHAMGADLWDYAVFRAVIQYQDNVLACLQNAPTWSLESVLRGDCEAGLVQTAAVSQAACTAVQVGLVDLLASWSIRPAGVVGHSSGEIAAAYASGRISAAEAIVAAYLRGQAVSLNGREGAMLAVGLGPEQVAEYVQEREAEVKVAAINSPGSVTLSGDVSAIDQLAATLTAEGIFNRKLHTGGNAYHSHHMMAIGNAYMAMLRDADGHMHAHRGDRYPHVSWVSSVTPTKSTPTSSTDGTDVVDLGPYWRSNLESRVRFAEAISRLVESIPVSVLVEIGPHPALKSPVEQILKSVGKTAGYVGTLKRNEDGQQSLLQLAGTLFTLNAVVDLAAVNAVDTADGSGSECGATCTSLPRYQYTYGGLNYHESRHSKEYRHRMELRHDLLGSKVVGTARLRPQWRNILRIKDVPWLGHHRLVPDAILPGAAYMAMAVEAVGHIYRGGVEAHVTVTGFELSDVTIDRSLVVPEDDYGVEVLTSLELTFDFFDVLTTATFSISSVGRDTGEWVQHCTGCVKLIIKSSNVDDISHTIQVPETLRPVDVRAWYTPTGRFQKVGLGYGPAFQPLTDVSSDGNHLAVASVALHTPSEHGAVKGGESDYPLHPAALDGAIQLGLIACHGGRPSEVTAAFVPVHLSRMYLSNDINDATAYGDAPTVVACGERRGIRSAHLDIDMRSPNGKVLLRVERLRCVSYSRISSDSTDRAFSSPFTRLVWRPDIRTISNAQARHRYPAPQGKQSSAWAVTNKLGHFVVQSIYETFGKLADGNRPHPSGDVGHFFAWIQKKGQHDQSPSMLEARKLACENRLLESIDELVKQAFHVLEVQIAKLLHDKMSDILFERRTGIDVIIGEGLLTPLYQSGLLMTGIYPQLHRIISGLAHADPNARILEIGGGTGGATRIAMNALNGPNGIKAYRDYTFTDISAGFLSGARELLGHLPDMKFSVFDIERDPVEQGYDEQTYNLIIACQVLHATSNMHRTLTNCRRLLKPGGRLVLLETNENFIVPGVVVGTFTGYWAGIPDGRVDAPFQSLDSWDRSLRAAGFSGLDVVLDDFPEPQNTTSVMLSTVPIHIPEKDVSGTLVHVLHSTPEVPRLVPKVVEGFEERGITATISSLGNGPVQLPPASHAVIFYDEQDLLANSSEKSLGVFQHLSENSATLLVLTSCGTVNGLNPDGALIPGLLRVLRNENPATEYGSIDIDATHFNVDSSEEQEIARRIVDCELDLRRSVLPEELESTPPDREFVWQKGCMWVSRHVPDAGFHSEHGLDNKSMKPELLPLSSQGAVRAVFESPGVPNSLCFASYEEMKEPLQPDYIDVEVAAIGLNSQDIDHWTGRVNANHLSSEYAGVVTAVGTNVYNLKVGDRVYGLGKGQFGNWTRGPSVLAQKLQPEDKMIQMASMPLAYTTATYVLEQIARLRKGQSVLIQSGAKDIGLAILNLAKTKEAVVFAIVETPEQVDFLTAKMGMPASRIISTIPTLAVLRRAAQGTCNGKFDVIVSTVSGEAQQSFPSMLSHLGHWIDMSQNEPQTLSTVNGRLLLHNASYCFVDPTAIFDTSPVLAAEIKQTVDKHYRKGLIGPIPRIEESDVSQIGSSLGNLANMIGKLVVSFENPESLVRMVPSPPSVRFDPKSFYVITGVLGGLGQSLVQWMASRGARHLALLSRRHVSSVPEAEKFITSLSNRGINVSCLVCDVSDAAQVNKVIKDLSSH